MNLIFNAVEALGSSGGTIRLSTRELLIGNEELVGAILRPSRPGQRFVEIAVADDGPGIPEEIRARVFDPLFTTKEEGFGFGLATVLGVVRNHEGALLLDTAVSRGTRLRLLLPLADPPAKSESPQSEEGMSEK